MRNRKSWVILLAAALLAISCFAAVFADDAVPGTAADPVVSKSYMDAQIDILTTQISVASMGKIASSSQRWSGSPPPTPRKSVIGAASTEIILRSGTATAIAGASGGVSDLTEGVDLSTGTAVTKNHLLVIPVDDGRGIQCTSTCYVMIKGDHTLK